MNAHDAWLADVTDLIISDHETSGRPALPPGSRPRLADSLERLLVDRVALEGHVRRLQQRLGRAFRHNEPPPDELAEAVLDRGVAALDDAALAALMLNPVALYALADAIDELLPTAWWPALERRGAELLREHGHEVPSHEELTGQPAEEEEAFLYSAALAAEASPASADVEQRWRFERRPEDCSWDAGDASLAAGRAAAVEVVWEPAGLLEVIAGGWLQTGPGRTLQAVWQDASGQTRARGTAADGGRVRMASGAGAPPRAGDRLLLRHVRSAAGEPSWDVRVTLTFCRGRPRTGAPGCHTLSVLSSASRPAPPSGSSRWATL